VNEQKVKPMKTVVDLVQRCWIREAAFAHTGDLSVVARRCKITDASIDQSSDAPNRRLRRRAPYSPRVPNLQAQTAGADQSVGMRIPRCLTDRLERLNFPAARQIEFLAPFQIEIRQSHQNRVL
jgi:hypothetical protein